MSLNNGKFTPKQSVFLALLLDGKTITAAADESRISRRQAQRWLADPAFMQHLKHEQAVVVTVVTSGLSSLARRAVRALESVLDHPGENGANIKRLAAVSILDQLQRYLEFSELSDRVAELEARAGIRDTLAVRWSDEQDAKE